jgi:hypothetical protein
VPLAPSGATTAQRSPPPAIGAMPASTFSAPSTEPAARATMSTWSGALTSGVVTHLTRAVALHR